MKFAFPLISAVVFSVFVMNAAHAEGLAEGAPLPAIVATAHDGSSVALAEAGATGYTLVYFYPKADTPGCTAQACSLRDAFSELSDLQVQVFGVSRDSMAAQAAFREKYSLPFTLLADVDGRVVQAFGVPSRGMFASRQAFLFKDGVLVWRDLSASTSKQAADVLAVISAK